LKSENTVILQAFYWNFGLHVSIIARLAFEERCNEQAIALIHSIKQAFSSGSNVSFINHID